MIILLIWLLFGVVTAVVASNKGRSGCGWFALGVLLGPFGFILALVVSKDERAADDDALRAGDAKKCAFCAELVKTEAIVCKHCGKDIPGENAILDDEPKSALRAFLRRLRSRFGFLATIGIIVLIPILISIMIFVGGIIWGFVSYWMKR